jgi:hypothetical protein
VKTTKIKHEDWAALVAGWESRAARPAGLPCSKGCNPGQRAVVEAVKAYVRKHHSPMRYRDMVGATSSYTSCAYNASRLVRMGLLTAVCKGMYIPGPNA